jgi:hypothetical protein
VCTQYAGVLPTATILAVARKCTDAKMHGRAELAALDAHLLGEHQLDPRCGACVTHEPQEARRLIHRQRCAIAEAQLGQGTAGCSSCTLCAAVLHHERSLNAARCELATDLCCARPPVPVNAAISCEVITKV